MANPSLYHRPCDICRKYAFNAETGAIEKTWNGKDFMLRRGPVPCETPTGCRKGHWKDDPDLTDSQQRVISLFMEMKACGFSSLPDEVRGCGWFRYVFGLLEDAKQRYVAESNSVLSSKIETLAVLATRK